MRDSSKLVQPKRNTTTFGLKSLTYFGSKLRNDLLIDFKDATDLALFRDRLRNWEGPNIDYVINFYVYFNFSYFATYILLILPRPVLAFGYFRCHRLSVPVCPCMCVTLGVSITPRDNSGLVQVRITKFGPKMQNTVVKVSFFLLNGGAINLEPSRSNLTWRSKFTPCWACPHQNSSSIQARITKFGPEVRDCAHVCTLTSLLCTYTHFHVHQYACVSGINLLIL